MIPAVGFPFFPRKVCHLTNYIIRYFKWDARGLMIFAALYSPEVAYAGAFTLEEGTGQAIATINVMDAAQGFGKNGKFVLAPHTSKIEPSLFVEYGARDGLTVFGQTSYVHNHIGTPINMTYSGLGYSELGARARIVKDGPLVLSVQSSIRLPGPSEGQNFAQAGNTGLEIDNRILAGTSFNLGNWASFMDGSFGYRTRGGKPANEWRADVTFGTRPVTKVLVLVQSFNLISDGSGTFGFPRTSSSKLQVSGVYDLTKQWSVQLGAYATLAAQNYNRESGFVAAIWRRF